MGSILNDLLIVVTLGGFFIVVGAKFANKDPGQVLKSMKDWVINAFKGEEEE